ncbi:putative lipoprotein [Leptospira inadai serovar Lyme str. 10]|uniref:Cys-rich protein n=2 Tax=Leptospira inadai serovar Lyme TaxID=293084 RepID=A0ABX4YDK8_9LEPT|nr:Cys-rich protein [Leptospira inadai]EQA38772.1 putative lipoprotein [Leptospira inadai serovar Lyme str. 10]PNV72425.1 Cys-rich protein [Leptospira inadai serovar Lyme]
MKPLFYLRIFPSLLLLLTFFSCKNPYERKCQEICKFYLSCAEEEFRGKQVITDADRNLVTIDCESGCLREQGFAVPCYESEKTCKGFNRCILESGLMD